MNLRLVLIALLLMVCPVAAQDAPVLDEEQHQRLSKVLIQLELLEELPITEATANKAAELLNEAASIIEASNTKLTTTVEVKDAVDQGWTSWSKKVGSYITFINVLWVFVGLVLTVALLGIFGIYLLPLFGGLPIEVWECLAYIGSIWAAFFSIGQVSETASFVVALISLPVFSIAAGGRTMNLTENWRLALGVITTFIGAAAVVHSSTFFGAISVLTFMWLCGSWFIPFVSELSIFEKHQYVPSAFWSAAALLAATAGLGLTADPEWLAVFKPGVFWVAGVVYAGGLMTLSCRYYYGKSQSWPNWLFWQIVAVASGIGALYVGNVYGVQLDSTVLQEIGGTFLGIYMIQKVAEVPWNADYWPWIALVIGVGGYYAVSFAAAHPAYFLAF